MKTIVILNGFQWWLQFIYTYVLLKILLNNKIPEEITKKTKQK